MAGADEARAAGCQINGTNERQAPAASMGAYKRMTHVEVQHLVKKHRPAALIGVIAGLAVLIGWVGYVALATPRMPDLQQAGPAEVVAYIASSRGLSSLPQIQQEQFLQRWRERLADTDAKQKLSAYLQNLSEDQRRQFGEAMFEHIKNVFLDDARRFSQLKAEEKNAFLRKKIAEYRDQVLAMKEVAAGFKGLIGSRPDDAQQYIVEHSTPRDRALGEPYADALKRVREQMKKEERVSKAGS